MYQFIKLFCTTCYLCNFEVSFGDCFSQEKRGAKEGIEVKNGAKSERFNF